MVKFDWTEPLISVPYGVYNAMSWITVSISFVLVLSLTIYHIGITVMWFIKDKHHVIHDQKQSAYLSSTVLIIAFLFCGICLHMTYTETYPVSLAECHVVKYSTTTSYTTFKMMLYILLVSRVYTVYSDGLYTSITGKALSIWTLIIILWTLCTNIINIFTTTTVLEHGGKCANEWAFLFLCSVISLDITAVVVFLYLFTKPLLVLAEKQREHSVDNRNYITLRRVALKQCILSLTASISTVIVGAFVFVFGMTQVFACLDVVISSICIILMYKWHDKLYRKLHCHAVVDWFIDNKELNIMETRLETMRSDATVRRVGSQSPKSMSTSGSQTPSGNYPYPRTDSDPAFVE